VQPVEIGELISALKLLPDNTPLVLEAWNEMFQAVENYLIREAQSDKNFEKQVIFRNAIFTDRFMKAKPLLRDKVY